MTSETAVVTSETAVVVTVGTGAETEVVTSETTAVTSETTVVTPETAAKAKVVEHKVAGYEVTDNPETHMPSPEVPKFCLKPKHERST